MTPGCVKVGTELPQLVNLFDAQNKALMAWLDTAASYLSEMIGDLQPLFDPEAFVIGGHLPELLLRFLCERCSNLLVGRGQPGGPNAPRILRGSLQDEAAALGAAALPIHDLIAPNYEGIANGDHLSLLEFWELGK